ncbi:FAD/NAD(P)-binding protein [Pseudomonas sp. UL073]|uniref:FAD/NAD(P)-binding protein n=1 Tax=Zestomonas insulae TaxID=2809017 RepID=A0ABS2IMR4_9GAMM|nr:FAD/NAD(P)-binding protein [Pseudomonas insulae]MBM7063168.1 FAD/NAD(P)-binding protein [Pseudomonas insulae]
MKTLAIIGTGFSGAVTAVQFLRYAPPGIRVILINRSGSMARGLAYGTNSPLHLLNVPAGNMTALAEEPDSFLSFCQERLPSITASSFIPRKIYGDYLSSLLNDVERRCRNKILLQRMVAEVLSLRPHEDGVIIELTSGEKLHANHVVLALGHFAPLDPPNIAAAQTAGRYQQDPWTGTAPVTTNRDKPALLLGTGLTALDVALGMIQRGHRGTIHMLSRRGLLPLPHREQRSVLATPAEFSARLLNGQPTVLGYWRAIRQQVEYAAMDGMDWRDLIAALRPITTQLWARLPDAERRRFLRHAQPYWDVHRHRVAPEAHQCFERAMADGLIKVMAGRVQTITPVAEGLRVSIRLRGTQGSEQLQVAQIVNCTSPNSNLQVVDEPLITQLREAGLIQPDRYGLGLHVDEQLAVVNAEGVPSTWLSYVGPMLKADFWEATAVPELRQHARNLAIRLAEHFRDYAEEPPAGRR